MVTYRRKGRNNEHAYLLDGDEYCLTPGVDFQTSIPTFRVKMSRMCKKRGITYRSQVDEHGRLWFEAYQNTPGDLFKDEAGPQSA
jgi:hypothetical protein